MTKNEINYQVRTVSNEGKESFSNSKTWHKLFNEGTEYISTTDPTEFTTVSNLNCPVVR